MAGSHPSLEHSSRSVSLAVSQRTNSWSGKRDQVLFYPTPLSFLEEIEYEICVFSDDALLFEMHKFIYQKLPRSSARDLLHYATHKHISVPSCFPHDACILFGRIL
jgi:hypothetical protein